MIKKLTVIAFFCIFITGSLIHAEDKEKRNSFRKGPYMIYPGNNESMHVLWQSHGLVFNAVVEWGTTRDYGKSSGSVKKLDSGEDGNRYRYMITGLTPGTRYYYRVSLDGTSSEGTFSTAPVENAEDTVIYVYGDTRSNGLMHNKVMKGIYRDMDADRQTRQTILLHSGDWTASDRESEWDNQFFNPSYKALWDVFASMPVMGARGNHENRGSTVRKYWPFFDDAFYYSFDYGPVHVTVIDQYTDHRPGSDQYTWIENDLANTDKAFKIVMYHHPAWGAGTHPNSKSTQQLHKSLFVKHGVAMAVNGHNHNYARAMVDGIAHCTIGGGGAPLYPVDTDKPNIVTAVKCLNFGRVEINGPVMTVTVMDEKGNLIDNFSLNSKSATESAK
jgi:hypothetical protein